MAETAKGTQIRENLAERLRTIRQAKGYRTDIGADVRTEPSKFMSDDGARMTVYPAGKQFPGDARSKLERECKLVLEVLVPVSLETPAAECEAAEADIEDALRDYLQQPMALPLQFDESLILERPDGVAAMGLQIMLSTRYR